MLIFFCVNFDKVVRGGCAGVMGLAMSVGRIFVQKCAKWVDFMSVWVADKVNMRLVSLNKYKRGGVVNKCYVICIIFGKYY